jgi:hypothetical protein
MLINVAGAVPQTDLFATTDAGWNEGLSLSPRGIADGVQANSVPPGPVMTDRRRSMLTENTASRGLSLAEEMRRFAAKAGMVADLAGFLTLSELRLQQNFFIATAPSISRKRDDLSSRKLISRRSTNW